jgi:hypothetical protein
MWMQWMILTMQRGIAQHADSDLLEVHSLLEPPAGELAEGHKGQREREGRMAGGRRGSTTRPLISSGVFLRGSLLKEIRADINNNNK